MIHELRFAGHGVGLDPLTAVHTSDLAALVDPDLWAGIPPPVPDTEPLMIDYVAAAEADPTRMAFAVIDLSIGSAVGSTSFYELNSSVRRIEIGHTFYGRSSWGTSINPACKLMLMTYAFEDLGLHRLALRCDARNGRSAAAIQRLGAKPEGILRGHRLRPEGGHGDTAYFSILAPEWPAAKAGLIERLGER